VIRTYEGKVDFDSDVGFFLDAGNSSITMPYEFCERGMKVRVTVEKLKDAPKPRATRARKAKPVALIPYGLSFSDVLARGNGAIELRVHSDAVRVSREDFDHEPTMADAVALLVKRMNALGHPVIAKGNVIEYVWPKVVIAR
jgi:hypothetical protein